MSALRFVKNFKALYDNAKKFGKYSLERQENTLKFFSDHIEFLHECDYKRVGQGITIDSGTDDGRKIWITIPRYPQSARAVIRVQDRNGFLASYVSLDFKDEKYKKMSIPEIILSVYPI